MKPEFYRALPGLLSTAISTVIITATTASAQVTVDGGDDGGEGYVQLAVQDVFSAWGGGNTVANLSAVQDGGNLALFIGSCVENNGLILFIDSKPGGNSFIPNNLITSGGEEGTINNFGSSDSAGMTFEAGFEPDYALRVFGTGSVNLQAYTNWYDFGTGVRSYLGEAVNEAPLSGGPVTEMAAYWSDVPGIDTSQYGTHTDGVELKLGLSAAGVPQGAQTVKVMAVLVWGDSTNGSNQVLGPRTGVSADMGLTNILDWGTEPGTQTISISVVNNDNDGDGDPDATDPDDDNDGLDDTVETDTGTYLNAGNTGTNPFIADTDGDSFDDGEEVDGSSSLGYVSNPNIPNFEEMTVPGSFNLPNPWTPDSGFNTPSTDMTQGSTASLTEQYQWTLDYKFDTANSGISYKFAAGTWANNWGNNGAGTVAYNGGGDITATINASGIHRFFFDQAALTHTFERVTYATIGEFLAAYGVASGANDDSDSLDSEEEFALGTDPTNGDTDGDGLKDDVENNTGTWVSASMTGTDPLNPDSDNDGLDDGAEDKTGVFVDANQTGTDPNEADTDGDGEDDGVEIFQGTDPNEQLSSSVAFGNPVIDGTVDSSYDDPLAVQTIETGFGDNSNEWNAGYARVANGKLYLTFTGNLENSFNKLHIFIDSVAGGSTSFTSAGNDGSAAMNGMVFDSAFAPDYHLIARRGDSKFDLDFADLGGATSDFYENIFGGADFGIGMTGTGTNSTAILAAYDGSNSAGIGGTTGIAADQVAAAAVTTGLELCIDLADLGNPTGSLRVMLLQGNNNHDFMSNQTLGGLPVGTGNLGDPTAIDFSVLAGDQFFSVTVPVETLRVRQIAYVDADKVAKLVVTGLTPGADYKVTESTTLVPPFSEVSGSTFTAFAPAQVISVPADSMIDPSSFFQVVKLP